MATILVVEDDPDIMVVARTVMQRAGHKVLTASEGMGALACVRDWSPDLVLLDVSLAGEMTGLDVCRAIRADPESADTAVILASGWAFDSDVQAGRDAGADAYLAKPFGPKELRSIVEEVLTRAHERAFAAREP